MALNTQIRAACLLFLLLSSLATTSSLQQQTGQLTRQPAERHPQYTAVTEAHLTKPSEAGQGEDEGMEDPRRPRSSHLFLVTLSFLLH
ncbi:hepcidin isoform X2 [Marmota marmota marmota]|uniref:hepcidin isoform X2 n=1 Tax=Marmota marmota marmota TaxID=9994 RepID=UPI0007625CAE|nr:hepcidin isoform X2 [Marmota marmota marmota]